MAGAFLCRTDSYFRPEFAGGSPWFDKLTMNGLDKLTMNGLVFSTCVGNGFSALPFPAVAGIYVSVLRKNRICRTLWIPAFAGMTGDGGNDG